MKLSKCFFSAAEMFRTLDKRNQGKIQLDLQQVKLQSCAALTLFNWSSLLSHDSQHHWTLVSFLQWLCLAINWQPNAPGACWEDRQQLLLCLDGIKTVCCVCVDLHHFILYWTLLQFSHFIQNWVWCLFKESNKWNSTEIKKQTKNKKKTLCTLISKLLETKLK